MQIILIGVNHRTASIELRERVAFDSEKARAAADQLRGNGTLEEVVVLSTCNRSEIYGVSPPDADDTLASVERHFAQFHSLSHGEMAEATYRCCDAETVRHLFRVASGLDSLLLGEAEILGQVRQAYKAALEHGFTGPALNRLFQNALEVGKRVRTQTDIGARPMSVAFAGIKLAERIFGKLTGRTGLILGAGTMAEQAVDHLRNRGISRLVVANRTREHGEELARRFGAEIVEWSDLSATLAQPEIVITSVAAAEPVITRAMLRRAMNERGNREMFLIDLGMPRNVDPAAAKLYNVFLYNMDDLTEIVEANRRARQEEIPRAEAIVSEHVHKFQMWHTSLQVAVIVDQLRRKLEHERDEFLRERLGRMSHLSPQDRQCVAELATELLEEVLRAPPELLADSRAVRQRLHNMQAARKLFGLAGEKP